MDKVIYFKSFIRVEIKCTFPYKTYEVSKPGGPEHNSY